LTAAKDFLANAGLGEIQLRQRRILERVVQHRDDSLFGGLHPHHHAERVKDVGLVALVDHSLVSRRHLNRLLKRCQACSFFG
jgi:hypothetical protein